MMKFNNLDSLLNASDSASYFFNSLPDYVKGVISKDPRISSEDELHRAAEGIIHEFI